MPETTDFLKEVGEIAHELEQLGLKPVLIGGMALVILGSKRVTQDFDFVVSKSDEQLEKMMDIFYNRGFELVSRLDKEGGVRTTIDNRKVAAIRLRLDEPSGVHLFNPRMELRIDLLFDFPISAGELIRRAKKTRITSTSFYVASEQDLVRLKEIAHSSRSSPRDAQDLDFLKARRKGSKSSK